MNEVRDWLANLSVRERNLVYGAAALLGVLLLYLVLVLPFQTADARLSKRVEQKSANLAWMREKKESRIQEIFPNGEPNAKRPAA